MGDAHASARGGGSGNWQAAMDHSGVHLDELLFDSWHTQRLAWYSRALRRHRCPGAAVTVGNDYLSSAPFVIAATVVMDQWTQLLWIGLAWHGIASLLAATVETTPWNGLASLLAANTPLASGATPTEVAGVDLSVGHFEAMDLTAGWPLWLTSGLLDMITRAPQLPSSGCCGAVMCCSVWCELSVKKEASMMP